MMERHIVEILVILIHKYPQGAITSDEFEPLTRDLIDRGYTQHEIETAFFWYHSRQGVHSEAKPDQALAEDSFRVLHEVERAVLTPEAYGYLISLRNLGMITLAEMDAIIERAVLLGGRRVDLDDIKSFVAAQIMEQDASGSGAATNYYLKIPSDRVQ
jgi:uncharacterized protein Smg (DUF494 family)